jgi:formate--tetrahydrofolate ligase
MTMPSALEISRQATLKPVTEIAAEAGLPPWLIQPYGEHVAQIDLKAIEELADQPRARYVLVTAVTPTPTGWRLPVREARASAGPGSSTPSAGTCEPCQG